MKNQSNLPVIIISGASGFIGRYFLEEFCNHFFIYALARRSQKAADISVHKNINWIRVDIANESEIKRILNEISNNGGADYFLHLAGYFDFHNLYDPEYQRTNVDGMRYILEASDKLNLKRFIFSSSLAILDFSDPSRIINEDSMADATYPYAVTKREGEQMLKVYSSYFPCTVIRLAAMFSDWCEHKPLYSLLSTWLSPSWIHRMLGGKGETSIPYLHIYDLINMVDRIITMTEQLPNYHILNASPGYSTSHKELFQIACKYNYFKPVKPIYTKKWFATFGVILRNFWGTVIGKPPFERLWMMKYIDKKLIVDSSRTRKLLNWEPTKRYNISRRLLFMIAKMKSNPYEWHYKNAMRPSYAVEERQYIKIYEALLQLKEQIIRNIHIQLLSRENSEKLNYYQNMNTEARIHCVEYIFKILEIDIRTGDRSHILEYAEHLAEHRYLENFPLEQVMRAITITANTIIRALIAQQQLQDIRQRIYDEIMLTFQMMKDEIEDTYMNLSAKNE